MTDVMSVVRERSYSPKVKVPQTIVRGIEDRTPITGSPERFFGYGVMGPPFASGYVLGLRRFTASSIGHPGIR
jgi:hypothetical protein